MKVLLYKPNDGMVSEEDGTSNSPGFYRPLPYSLAVCASVLRDNGKNVSVLDAMAEGLSPEKSLARIEKVSPDILVVVINVITVDLDLRGIEDIKAKTGCKVAVLINYPFEREVMIRHPVIDVTIRHEWAWAADEVVGALSEGMPLSEVKGIFIREGQGIVQTSPRPHIHIDKLPLPALDLLPMRKYNSYQVMMTYGCNHHCLFCPFRVYPKTGWEAKSVEKVIAELKLMKSYGNKIIFNIDNELTLDLEYVKELANRMISERLNVVLSANTRVTSANDELYRLMSKAGFLHLSFGVESANQTVLDMNKKELALGDVIDTYRLLEKQHITTKVFFLIGLLGDTRETIAETFSFITKTLKPYDASFDIVVPYPGTPFYTYLKKKGWIDELTIDNLVWIYQNVYHWEHLEGLHSEKPSWRVGDLTFDDLVELEKKYYGLVPHGGYLQKLKRWLCRGPSFMPHLVRYAAQNSSANMVSSIRAVLAKK